MDPNDPPLSFELKRSSWENIFRVLKWAAPMNCSNEEGYKAQEGEFWSIGGFWAQVQELQRQLGEHKRLAELHAEEWPPLTASDLEKLERPCGLCGAPFAVDDRVCHLEIEPADAEEAEKKRRGRLYHAACDVVHKRCYDRASGLVEFAEHN